MNRTAIETIRQILREHVAAGRCFLRDFCALRDRLIGSRLISSRCRGISPYRYIMNTGVRAERYAGRVAQLILAAAQAEGHLADQTYPVAAWCAQWPRTRRSLEAEAAGERLFTAACSALIGEDHQAAQPQPTEAQPAQEAQAQAQPPAVAE